MLKNCFKVFSRLFLFLGFLGVLGVPDYLLAATPTVTTNSSVSSITKTTASVSGAITGNGGSLVTGAGYNYGTTTSYGSTAIAATIPYVYNSKFGSVGAGNGQFSNPRGIAIDSSGNIYVADTGNNRIQIFNSSGVYQSQFGTTGTGDGQFDEPAAIAFDSVGNIFVSEVGNQRVQKFNSAGVYQSKFGTPGSLEGEFTDPFGIAIDSSDNIYIADTNNYRVQKFNSAGVFQLAYGRGVDTGAASFETCTSGCQTGSAGTANGEFNQPYGIDFDSSGNVLVSSLSGGRVQKFTSSGVYVSQFGTNGVGDNQMSGPTDIHIDAADNVYVAEIGFADRIHKFDSSGVYVSQFGTTGSLNGQFDLPTAIAFDSEGNVFVSELNNNRVQKFSLSVPLTTLSGLTCGTTYHFQAYAVNGDGTSTGSDQTFTTLSCQPPTADTLPATSISKSAATLNGLYVSMPVLPGVSRGFEYGLTTSYGTTLTENGNEYISQFNSTDTPFTTPQGITVDSSGNIYVADTGNNIIQKFDSSGAWILNITGDAGNFSGPSSVYVDSSDNVYVSDPGNNRVQKFDSSGTFQLEIGTGLFAGTFTVSVDSYGNIYVADTNAFRVAKFDSLGNYVSDFASGEFSLPNAIDFDSAGNAYVADSGTSSIKIFDASGVYQTEFATGELGSVLYLQIDSDDSIYVANPDYNELVKYNTAGTRLYTFGTLETSYATALAPDGNGNIFVADTNNGIVRKFSLEFSRDISSLSCETTYNYRAFITNNEGTGYGDNETFTTSSCGGGGGGSGGQVIYGCTQPGYYNYNPSATVDDGSCHLIPDPPTVCLDPDATNYLQPSACFYNPGAIPGCTDPTAGNYNSSATVDNSSCIYGVFGCMDPLANNYNPLAEYSNGSCMYDGNPPGGSNGGCTNAGALNYDADADYDDGSCDYAVPLIYGCTDVSASNFDSGANADNGSCAYIGTPDVDVIGEVIGGTAGAIRKIPEEILVGISVAGIVGPGLLLNFLQPGLLAALVSIPLRLWNLIPILMGYRRKKRPWGTVYDSVTKQPLDPVYVTLNNLAGAEVGSSITDLDGRYGFLAEAGTYTLSAKKDNYVFPSAKLVGKSADDLYNNLYFGGPVTLEEKEGVIFKNIPMDALNFNWNEFAKASNKKLMKFYSKRDLFFARTAKTLFIAGFVSSLALFLVNNSTLNTVILGLYAVILLLRLFGVKPKQSGYAYDKDGTPLSFGIIKLFSAELDREVAHTVIGKTGRYYMLVPNGEYYMKVSRKTGEDSYEDLLISDNFRVKNGYVKEKIQA